MAKGAKITTIWLTRDSDHEGLSDIVSVWKSRPLRHRLATGGAFWLDNRDNIWDRISRYRRADAVLRFRTLPDTDLECIRIAC